MITLHKDRAPNSYTYRQGNHIGRIFTASNKADFVDALHQFNQDIGQSPYPMTDVVSTLSDNSAKFVNRQ